MRMDDTVTLTNKKNAEATGRGEKSAEDLVRELNFIKPETDAPSSFDRSKPAANIPRLMIIRAAMVQVMAKNRAQ